MRRLLRRLFISVSGLIAVVVLLLAVTPQGRTGVRTALFIPQVLPTIPLRPQEWVTRDPLWEEVRYPTADGEGRADLILPAGSGKHSAVLFFLGVAVDPPREDRRVVALAEGLARSGMAVMIPWSETQLQQRIVPEDIDGLVWAFQYLRALDSVDPERVGMGGICTGSSMAMVAAQDERIRDQVKFVNSLAGYYDAFDFLKAISSRSRFYGDYIAPWDTDKLTLKVFRNQLIDGLTDAADRDLLVRIFRQNDSGAEAEVASLSPEGMAAYRIAKGVPFEEFDALVTQLSPQTTEFLRRISPSTNIDQIKARVLVMHDRADRLVPSEESRRLAEALSGRSGSYHTEFSLFQKEIQLHEDQDVSVGPLDFSKEAFKLFLHMYNVMREVS
jgi:dienelactone hydrolase